MPLGFGSGELADRMRRALDIRGRIPLAVDEVVVPVALVSEPQAPPFRISGRRCFFAAATAAGGAGTVFRARIMNPTQVDAILDRVQLWQEVGTGFNWNIGAGSGLALETGANMWTFEGMEQGAVIGLTGLLVASSTPASPGPAISTGISNGFSGSADPTVDLKDLECVIPPGGDVTIVAYGQNVATWWAVSCRYFDDVPRLTS